MDDDGRVLAPDLLDLPAPLTPAVVDLRDYEYMPLHVARLRDSETAFKTRGDEFRCAVLLWCAAWHQVPAASLPDDEGSLARYAGFGIAIKEWRKVRAGALRGFVKCSDGRLYHAVLATVAVHSWIAKLRQLWRSDCERLKKQAQRTRAPFTRPDFDLWISRECPEAIPYVSRGHDGSVPEDSDALSPGQHAFVPGKMGPIEVKLTTPVVSSVDNNYSNAHANSAQNRQKAGRSKPAAHVRLPRRWKQDPDDCAKAMRLLGITPGTGKSLHECVSIIQQEIARREREAA
jgi:hypothetical protein